MGTGCGGGGSSPLGCGWYGSLYAFSYHSCPDILTSPTRRVTMWAMRVVLGASPESATHRDRSVNSNRARSLWFQGGVGVGPDAQTQRGTYTSAHVMSRKDTGIPS